MSFENEADGVFTASVVEDNPQAHTIVCLAEDVLYEPVMTFKFGKCGRHLCEVNC